MKEQDWLVFQLPELRKKIERGNLSFQEFLSTPSLSCSIYHVPAGSKEMQRAHEEDELYLVLEGKGRLRVDGDSHAVQEGTLMYVRAYCDHAFFDVDEDITALAFFGTAVRRLR